MIQPPTGEHNGRSVLIQALYRGRLSMTLPSASTPAAMSDCASTTHLFNRAGQHHERAPESLGGVLRLLAGCDPSHVDQNRQTA